MSATTNTPFGGHDYEAQRRLIEQLESELCRERQRSSAFFSCAIQLAYVVRHCDLPDGIKKVSHAAVAAADKVTTANLLKD